MDLFSLVARLTLEEKEYEKALKQAERKASSAKVDVSGEIRVNDHFSDALNRVQSAADHFDGDVSGDITANDQYTDKVVAAEGTADNADLDAEGELSADDKYSGDLTSAEGNAANAELDADGELTATDSYTGVLDTATGAAAEADLSAEGTLSADDQYSDALATAETNASTADLDADGVLFADDAYTGVLGDAEKEAAGAALDAEGQLTADDQYSPDLAAAVTAAAEAYLDANGLLSADDQYTGSLNGAEGSAAAAALDADGELTATDNYSGTLDAVVGAATDADLNADGVLSAEDQYTEDLESAETDASTADLDAEGELTADDLYSSDLADAEADAASANLDAEGIITIDTSDVSESLEEAETATSDFESHLTDMVDSLQSKLKAAGIALTIKGIASAFQGALQDTAQYADTVDKGAQALSISREEYQKWDYALAQSGASIGTITRGFKNLSSFLGGEATDDINAAMEALQINPEDYKGTEDLFAAVVGTLAEMEEGSERDNLVTALFGRNGVQLNALLNSGKDGIEELREEAERLGMVLSDEDIANAVTYGDALSRMNRTIDGLKMRVMTALMPVLTEAADQVAELVPELENAMKTGDWQPFFDKFNQGIGKIFQGIGQAIGIVNVDGTLNLPPWLETVLSAISLAIDAVKTVVTWIGDFLGLTARSREAKKNKAMTNLGLADAEDDEWTIYAQGMMEKVIKDPSQLEATAVQHKGGARGVWYWQSLGHKPGEGDTPGWGDSDLLVEIYDAMIEAAKSKDEKQYEYRLGQLLAFDKAFTSGKRGNELRNAVTNEAALAAYQASLNTGGTKGASELNLPEGASAYIPEGAVYAEGADVNADGAYIFADGTIVIPPATESGDSHRYYYPDGTTREGYDPNPGRGDIVWYNRHAKGLWDVPYDDYAALLHRDEMVLTASQARDYRDGSSDSDTMMDLIQLLRTDMANLKIQVGEKVFGQTVVDYSGRKMRGYIGRAEDRVISGYGWG